MIGVIGATTVETTDVTGATDTVVEPTESDPTEIVPPDVLDVPTDTDPMVKDPFKSVPDAPVVVVPLLSPEDPGINVAKAVNDLNKFASILSA